MSEDNFYRTQQYELGVYKEIADVFNVNFVSLVLTSVPVKNCNKR